MQTDHIRVLSKKAFDTVDLRILLLLVEEPTLPGYLKRRLANPWVVRHLLISVNQSQHIMGGTNLSQLRQELNSYLHKVSVRLKEKQVLLSKDKYSETLFTLDQRCINTRQQTASYLIDIQPTCGKYQTQILGQEQCFENILGKDKETLSLTYDSIGRPTSNCCTYIRTTFLSQ